MTPVLNVIFFGVAAAAIAPLVPLCLHPKFVRAFPRIVFSCGAVILAYLAVLTLTALWRPALLLWFAMASSTEAVFLIWRSRRAYGSRRNLPPGSLTILPLEPWLNRFHYAQLADEYGPIFKTSHFYHPMVCIMNLESGLDLLKEHDDVRLRSPKVLPDRFMPCGFLRGMEPENHKLYRRLVQSLITPEV